MKKFEEECSMCGADFWQFQFCSDENCPQKVAPEVVDTTTKSKTTTKKKRKKKEIREE